MFAWVSNHFPTILLLLLLAAAIFFAARSVHRSRKSGGCAGCSGCSQANGCPHGGSTASAANPNPPPDAPSYHNSNYQDFS